MSILKSEKLFTHQDKNNSNLLHLVAEPLERGFAITLGNALRRVLLSSLQGAAVTYVKITGVDHEFQPLPGVKEDIIDILVNLKNMVVRMSSPDRQVIKLKVSGPCVVTAGMIDKSSDVNIVDPDHVICTLESNSSLEIEMICEMGRGYVPASMMAEKTSSMVGYIALDAIFSPVRSVSYEVKKTRVGQVTDYDKLHMSIETNGSMLPNDALSSAAKILQEHFALFLIGSAQEYLLDSQEPQNSNTKFHPVLLKKISSLELSVRARNCLNGDNVVYIGDLVQKTEAELLKLPHFGKKSLDEINYLLDQLNREIFAEKDVRYRGQGKSPAGTGDKMFSLLTLGMKIPDWNKDVVDSLIKKK